MAGGSQEIETISEPQVLYRKSAVRLGHVNLATGDVAMDAFSPVKNDIDGLSLSFARSSKHPEYLTLDEIAEGQSPPGYYLIHLNLAKLTEAGITIVPDPVEATEKARANPGHCLIPALAYENRKSDEARAIMFSLVGATIAVSGPYNIKA